MLRTIEQAVGRDRFDVFLRAYFDHFAFRSITTEEFLEYIRRELPNPVPLDEWIFRPGIPAGAAEPHSDVFARIESGWPRDTSRWSTHEWLHFLRKLENPDMPRLDREFHLTQSGNSEILNQWLLMSVKQNYEPAFGEAGGIPVLCGPPQIPEAPLRRIDEDAGGKERARRIYAKARSGYHPIAQATIDAQWLSNRIMASSLTAVLLGSALLPCGSPVLAVGPLFP